MSSGSSSTASGGVDLVTIVFAIFLTLKLGGWGVVATWSWWWVTSPLWIPVALVLGFGLIFLMCAGLVAALGALCSR